MKRCIFFKTICLILALIPLSAFGLPTADFSRFIDREGEGESITYDTVTGLEWLGLNETRDQSYLIVAEQLNQGGSFEGFRFATDNEVLDLFMGFNIPEGGPTPINDGILEFMRLFSKTGRLFPDSTVISMSRGFVNADQYLVGENPRIPHFGVTIFSYFDRTPFAAVDRGASIYWTTYKNPDMSSFLVRQYTPTSVPEIDAGAAPIALSLLVLTGLLRWERRRAVKS